MRGPVTRTSDLHGKGVKVFGNPDTFKLLLKVSSPDFSKSTKALQVEGGCLVQVSTRERMPGGGWAVAEALTFVPGVQIAEEFDAKGEVVARSLVGRTAGRA